MLGKPADTWTVFEGAFPFDTNPGDVSEAADKYGTEGIHIKSNTRAPAAQPAVCPDPRVKNSFSNHTTAVKTAKVKNGAKARIPGMMASDGGVLVYCQRKDLLSDTT